MLIASWNVNSVKQRLDHLISWLEERRPELVCLQETKCVDEAFPREPIEALGYNLAVHGQKTFNGVTILSRLPFDEVTPRLLGRIGPPKRVRCAIYTRVSTDQGLEQDFNSLDAQYDASQAYIRSQAHAGWTLLRAKYDDGGFSGGNTDRPALQQLLDNVRAGKVDVIVVYKVDRLTRSLADFAKLVELFDAHNVSFVSVTQQFNTTTSMGRLTLNVLLSFAQFEREVTSERIRDKIAASKRKGLWVGGMAPLGYDTRDRKIKKKKKKKIRAGGPWS